jgi:DNA polymerase III subunit epsilon
MREIVLDTETTGLDPKTGDRLIEIGCVEIFNRRPTGATYHVYINPERDVPAGAQAVHGITTAYLLDKPLFKAVVADFIAFIGDDPLVIHNANFDIGFLNFELARLGKPGLAMDRVVDTLTLARRKHPAGPNSLDALCKRYGIDGSKRVKHGALTDSELLAEVYIELLGERQAGLALAGRGGEPVPAGGAARAKKVTAKVRPTPLPARVTVVEIEAHAAFVAPLGDKALWKRFSS